jgi:hypothetical protein
MKKIIILSALHFWGLLIFAQNPFLDFTNPNFKEIQHLLVDSMVVTNNTNDGSVRHIGWDYDARNRPIAARDSTFDKSQKVTNVNAGTYTYTPGRLVFSGVTKAFAPFPYELRDRTTVDSLANGKVASIFYEIWNDSQWKPNGKDHYVYNSSGNLTEIWAEQWDFIKAAWKKGYSRRYEYDAKGNNTVLQYLNGDESTGNWILSNEYVYQYNANNKKTEEVWRNYSSGVMTNVNKSIYVYDNTNLVDTIKNYNWVAAVSGWVLSYVVTLDNSPEQQITQFGKRYQANAQGQLIQNEETTFIPGPMIYTNQPAEQLTKVPDAATNTFVNSERFSTIFTDLPDGTIKADHKKESFANGNWSTVYHVQAWQRKPPVVSVQNIENKLFIQCGMPNPLATEMIETNLKSLSFSPSAVANFYNMNGQKISGQPDASGIYWLRVEDRGRPVCGQKVMVR